MTAKQRASGKQLLRTGDKTSAFAFYFSNVLSFQNDLKYV